MRTIRYLIEHLIPLLFGAILALASDEITFDAKDLALWSLGLVIFFWVYSTVFEDLKRLLFFRLSRRRTYCGLYAELYLIAPGRLAVATSPHVI